MLFSSSTHAYATLQRFLHALQHVLELVASICSLMLIWCRKLERISHNVVEVMTTHAVQIFSWATTLLHEQLSYLHQVIVQERKIQPV
jgi:hypothetical protein